MGPIVSVVDGPVADKSPHVTMVPSRRSARLYVLPPGPLQCELSIAALVVLDPVLRRGQHDPFHRGAQGLVPAAGKQLFRDGVEAVEGFTQDEGKAWPDLEDGKAVLHQVGQ